jgi:hypothetical protein
MSNSVQLQSNGIVWSYGDSQIYDNGNLTIHTDDELVINAVNQVTTNTALAYYSGSLQINGYNSAWNGVPISWFFTSSNNSRFTYLSVTGNSGSYNTNDTAPYDNDPNRLYGLFVRHRIGCGDEIDIYSDKRIKNNINNIDSKNALITLRKIQPKNFTYIDLLKNNMKINYGFIAQEINDVFSDAITQIYEYIPNIYDCGIVKDTNIISMLNKTTNIFTLNNIQQPIQIKLFVNNKEEIVTLKEIIDEHTFIINEKIGEITDNTENKVFIYGQGVNDFHILEKNAIFTLTTSAVKQLDQELQETKNVIEIQKKQIEDKQKQIDSLLEQINSLKELLISKLN